ncbi:MAG: hypothetical protein N2663_05090 [Chlorobi bacterium]|nr:hypothetical protein [Chlorobiota bacterium]
MMHRIVAIGIICCAAITAQQRGASTDTITGSDFLQYVSTGWFPRPYNAVGTYIGSALNVYQHSSAGNIHTRGTRPIAGTWSTDHPFRSREEDIKKPWSDDNADVDFPDLGYSAPVMARVEWNVPLLHCIVRLDAMYEISRERLYYLDTSRKYLSLSGMPTPFREVSILFNNEHFLGTRLGVMVPIYGAFVTSEPLQFDSTSRFTIDRLSSFYYVSAGIHGAALILSEATQYVQIADAKSALRYANGQDTVTLLHKARLSTAAPVRWHADVSIGWQASFGIFSFSVEAYASFPLSSVLNDAQWMLYRYGLRTAIGWER